MKAKLAVGALVVAFLFYAGTIGWRGVLLILDGRPVAVVLGASVLVLPLVAAYAIWRELSFGFATERLARELAARGALPVDDLPRRPSGRVERSAADAAFAAYRQDAERRPGDWAVWFRLGTAYDAAGDRRRARAAVRQAIELHDSAGPTAP
jgi:hypothetical protein